MSEIIIFVKENAKIIFIIVIVVIFLLVWLKIKGINLNEKKPESKLVQQVTVETFETTDEDISIMLKPADNFCGSYLGNSNELETACNNLSESNCRDVKCCVYLNTKENNKCVAGDISGPTYKTDKDGKLITMDSYYYLGKMYNTQ